MQVQIGDRTIGDGHPCYVIAEIGINHNGCQDILQRLIETAADCGCDAVKLQKRTVDVVYSPEELTKPRQSPFGDTNGDLKRGLELTARSYDLINQAARGLGLHWFASPWDVQSVEFLEHYCPPCHKIASACITDHELIRAVCGTGRPVLMSTGMSNWREMDSAVDIVRVHGNPLVLLHTVSTYPAKDETLNLRMIQVLRERYNVPVGYSGHEVGLSTTVAAVALGACCVERHITLDRSMYGSDQAASVEPEGFRKLVMYIRTVEAAMGDGIKRVLDEERPIQAKLRRVIA